MRFWITTVVALISVMLVSCTDKKRAETVTIRAVSFTGESFSAQPIWSFVITNTGKSQVCWMAWIEVQGGGDKNYSNAGGHIDWPEDVFAPGQGMETNMIVPAQTGSVWRACVESWTISPQEMKKAQDAAARFGVPPFGFLPRHQETRVLYNDEWHH